MLSEVWAFVAVTEQLWSIWKTLAVPSGGVGEQTAMQGERITHTWADARYEIQNLLLARQVFQTPE